MGIAEHDPTLLKAARRAHQAGDLDTAWDLLEDWETLFPSLPTPFRALTGLVAIQRGDAQLGCELIQAATRAEPAESVSDSALAADIGLGLLYCGQAEASGRYLERAAALPDPDAAAYTRLATLLLARGELDRAEECFARATALAPWRAEVHCNLGNVLARQGKLHESLAAYEQAMRLRPDLAQAMEGRTRLLMAMERADEAVLEMEEQLAAAQNEEQAAPLRQRLVRTLSTTGRMPEALGILRSRLAQQPEDADALLQLALLHFSKCRYGVALAPLRTLLELEPDNIRALVMQARALAETSRAEEARRTMEQALERFPDDPLVLLGQAEVLAATGRAEEAGAIYERLTSAYPGWADVWSAQGHHLLLAGRIPEAVASLERAALLNPLALASLVEARSFPEDPATLQAMEQFASNPLYAPEVRSAMHFALSKIHEQRGQADEAFASAERANVLVRPTIQWSHRHHSATTESIIRHWSRAFLETFRAAGAGIPTRRPVFVVGMPRSGTTLVEQILASHSRVFGAGELGCVPAITTLMPRVIGTDRRYPECLPDFKPWMAGHAAAYYLKKLQVLDGTAERVVDKLPHNFLHLGLIRAIFPNAAIIHVRRDLRDVAVSNYFTNFRQRHGGMGYAFSLEDIGHMANDYLKIMRHWDTLLPDPPLLVRYEELVDDPEGLTRRMLDFVGLDWEPDVLRFHQTRRTVRTASAWQVRQPLYSSSLARWRRYAEHLEPLLNVLGEY